MNALFTSKFLLLVANWKTTYPDSDMLNADACLKVMQEHYGDLEKIRNRYAMRLINPYEAKQSQSTESTTQAD